MASPFIWQQVQLNIDIDPYWQMYMHKNKFPDQHFILQFVERMNTNVAMVDVYTFRHSVMDLVTATTIAMKRTAATVKDKVND